MNRNLRVKRLWSMGQFNNVELFDEILDIPEKVALNPRAVELLYHLMIMEQELAHKRYLEVFKKHPTLLKIFPESLDYLNETVLAIKEEKTRTFEEFLQEYNKE